MRRHPRERLGLLALLIAVLAPCAAAQGPHEVALLVNENSPVSLEIANHYRNLRGIPPQNVVRLRLDNQALDAQHMASLEAFRRQILDPAQLALAQRGVAPHILAWVYAPDFPTRVRGSYVVSLQGATFVRGRLPEEALVKGGRFPSPFFAGPTEPKGPRNPPRSLLVQSAQLGADRPLPSMLLGYAGPGGMTAEGILAGLRRSAAGDGSRPRHPVALLTNGNVRTQARLWQFDETAQELAALGLPTLSGQEPPSSSLRVSGLMAGAATIRLSDLPPLAPGAMAEHLTSFGAAFHVKAQTKITEWIMAGAAASAGTVLEPRAIWTKFPHARYFVHAASGCTVLESFVQSLASPMETLLLGDPLANPWGAAPQVLCVNVTEPARDEGFLVCAIQVLGAETAPRSVLRLFMDGREFQPAAPSMPLRIPLDPLSDGYHELRIVAHVGGGVLQQGFSTLGFHVNQRGRSVELVLPERDPPFPIDQPLEIAARCTGEPERLELLANGQVVATSDTPNEPVRLELAKAGRGPSLLQFRALYPDGMAVLSAPAPITVE